MNINVLKIIKQVRNHKQQKQNEAKPMGSIIKFKRKEMNLTLEEASENICSVSYLSKLENNIIKIGDKFITPLINRFGLDELQIDDHLNYDNDIEELVDSMVYLTKPRGDLIEFYKEKTDYKSKLIKMVFYALDSNYIKAMQSNYDLTIYIPNLTNTELALYLIAVNLYLYSEKQYSEAYRVLLQMPDLNIVDVELKIVIMKWRLLSAFRMHKTSDIFMNYHKLTRLVVQKGYYKLLKELEIAHFMFQSTVQNPKYIIDIQKDVTILNQTQKDFLLAKSLFHTQEFGGAISLTKKHYKKNSDWLVLHLILLDQVKMIPELEAVIASLCESRLACNTTKVIVKHMKYKHNGDKERLLNYLRREVLGFKSLTDEYYILDFLMMDSQKIFSSLHYYKEAVQVVRKYAPRLKALRQASSSL